MSKFKNKYRIESSRLKNWDYGSNGNYFVTICTKNMECYFGDIVSVDPIVPIDPIGSIETIGKIIRTSLYTNRSNAI